MKSSRIVVAIVALIALGAPLAAQQALGSSFLYQGSLNELGSGVTDSADFEFALWDAGVGGSQVAATLTVSNVSVVDGLFSVELDFGPAAFAGDALWLEVSVRRPHDPGDAAPFTTLQPRQPLAATPYAQFAASSAQWRSVGTAITNSNTGFVGINRTNTVGLEWFGVHAPVNTGYGGMYVTTEGATAWPFYGYRAGTQAAWTYLDGSDGDWHVNVDGNKLTVTDEGMVGIRTSSPDHPLHVVSTNTDRTIHGENSTASGIGVRGQATHATGSNTGVYGETSSSAGRAVSGYASSPTGETRAGRFYAESSSGMGVDAAAGFIGVSGTAFAQVGESWGGFFQNRSPQGAAVVGLANHATGSASGVWGQCTSDNGWGVRGQAPRVGVEGEASDLGGTGVRGWGENAGIGVEGIGGSVGVMAIASETWGTGVSGQAIATSGTPKGVHGYSFVSTGYAGYFEGGRNYFQGNVGCGTEDPTNPLSVVGDADITGRVSIGVTGADARLLVRGTTGEDAFRVRVDTASKLVVKDNGGIAVGSNFGTVPPNGMRIAGAVGIGADPGAFTLVSNGDAAKPGGGSWSNFSDARLKRDIRPIEPGMLDRLLSLHGRTFDYLETAVENRLGLPGRQTGLIAQEVQAVFPDWVGADDEGYLYVTERGLTAIVVEALRELRSETDAQVASLRAENQELRRRLEQIETALGRLAAAGSEVSHSVPAGAPRR